MLVLFHVTSSYKYSDIFQITKFTIVQKGWYAGNGEDEIKRGRKDIFRTRVRYLQNSQFILHDQTLVLEEEHGYLNTI